MIFSVGKSIHTPLVFHTLLCYNNKNVCNFYLIDKNEANFVLVALQNKIWNVWHAFVFSLPESILCAATFGCKKHLSESFLLDKDLYKFVQAQPNLMESCHKSTS